MSRNFQNLSIWQKGIQITKTIYAISKKFPKEETYSLIDQIRRAAASIPANISEGSGRTTDKDFCHFISIAQGSANEVITFLVIAKELSYIGEEEMESILIEINHLSKMMTNFQKSIRATNVSK